MSTPAEDAIRAEIATHGPIPFARFMALALGHPDGGYYTGPRARPTRGGDFLTAPELHPVFGAALARQVAEAWERLGRPDPFTLVEYGAGAGTLALAILAGLREDRSPLADALVYAPIELNPHRLAELEERAASAGLPLVAPRTDLGHGRSPAPPRSPAPCSPTSSWTPSPSTSWRSTRGDRGRSTSASRQPVSSRSSSWRRPRRRSRPASTRSRRPASRSRRGSGRSSASGSTGGSRTWPPRCRRASSS